MNRATSLESFAGTEFNKIFLCNQARLTLAQLSAREDFIKYSYTSTALVHKENITFLFALTSKYKNCTVLKFSA